MLLILIDIKDKLQLNPNQAITRSNNGSLWINKFYCTLNLFYKFPSKRCPGIIPEQRQSGGGLIYHATAYGEP